MYKLICAACNYYLFSTEDPFRSIGWQQANLFHLLVMKAFEEGYSREKISELLLLASSGGLSRESLHIDQELVLIAALKTSDLKYMAVEEARKLIENQKAKLQQQRKDSSDSYKVMGKRERRVYL